MANPQVSASPTYVHVPLHYVEDVVLCFPLNGKIWRQTNSERHAIATGITDSGNYIPLFEGREICPRLLGKINKTLHFLN